MAATTAPHAADGIVRNLDDVGRLVIPIELRQQMNLGPHDPIEIRKHGNVIELRKPGKACLHCSGSGKRS
jgi:AbrB family transcriptional regulator, transcriptional pleiotropic regulator of transition state genes